MNLFRDGDSYHLPNLPRPHPAAGLTPWKPFACKPTAKNRRNSMRGTLNTLAAKRGLKKLDR